MNAISENLIVITTEFQWEILTFISGIRHDVDEICAPLGPLKMGPIRCPETLVNNYHTTPSNIPAERMSQWEIRLP
jgi:hypothetical protein